MNQPAASQLLVEENPETEAGTGICDIPHLGSWLLTFLLKYLFKMTVVLAQPTSNCIFTHASVRGPRGPRHSICG